MRGCAFSVMLCVAVHSLAVALPHHMATVAPFRGYSARVTASREALKREAAAIIFILINLSKGTLKMASHVKLA